MKLNKEILDKALAEGDLNTLLVATENIIYYTLHNTGLWTRFPNYRDDFLQEGRLAILDAYKHFKTGKGASFPTYAHTIVRNRIFTYIRGLKWLKDEVDYELNPDHIDLTYDMKPLTLYDTLVDEINAHEHKNALKLYFLDEYTQDEVAKKTGMSQQWVYTTISNFRNDMRIKYGKMFGINTTNERIKMYKHKTKRSVGDFYYKGVKIAHAWYYESKRKYVLMDENDKTIATIDNVDKMTKKQLIRKYGDK